MPDGTSVSIGVQNLIPSEAVACRFGAFQICWTAMPLRRALVTIMPPHSSDEWSHSSRVKGDAIWSGQHSFGYLRRHARANLCLMEMIGWMEICLERFCGIV